MRERGASARQGELLLSRLDEVPAEGEELAPAFALLEVVHLRGKRSREMHAPILADAAKVFVGGMVEEMYRGGARGGVLPAEGFPRAALAHELDEALVLRADGEDVEREGPEHAICRRNFSDYLPKCFPILFQFFDFLGNIEKFKFNIFKF